MDKNLVKNSEFLNGDWLRDMLNRYPNLPIMICSDLDKRDPMTKDFYAGNATSYRPVVERVLDCKFEGEPRRQFTDEEALYTELRDEIRDKVGDVPNLDELADAEFDRYQPFWKDAIIIYANQRYEED